ITLTTNGTLLNETSAQKIVDSRIDKICISLDASTPETYLKTRGKDSFNQILEGIRILINAREKEHSKTPLVGVNFVILEENKKEILDFVKLAVSLGVDFIGTLRFPLPISPEGAYIDKSKTSLEGIYNQLVEAKKYIETRKLFIKESLIRNPETVFNFGDRKGFFCSAPWEYPQITWEGEVTPCCVIPFSEVYSLGNIGKSSFGEIWNNPGIWSFRRKIKKSTPPINWCKKCFY
ncbi:MAG: radical SAM protein, partial [bacterium]|nr:radical SAM protein [bacterium]